MLKNDREAQLGQYSTAIDTALREMDADRSAREHAADWLHVAEVTRANLPLLQAFVEDMRSTGYSDGVLIGMGGASLSPSVYHDTLHSPGSAALDLHVLNSTNPAAVLSLADTLDPRQTLVVVSSKSGTTKETLAGFRFFYNWMADAVGPSHAGEHFVTITTSGSNLAALAEHHHFRATFLDDHNKGARHSELSYAGLVPAALCGVDIARVLDRGAELAAACAGDMSTRDNTAAWLGTVLGELAVLGRDKLTVVTPPSLDYLGDWMEQKIAERTGKDGVRILVVAREPLGPPGVYGDDRVFVHLKLAREERLDVSAGTSTEVMLEALHAAGHPVLTITLRDLYNLASQFVLWGTMTTAAAVRLGIDPFVQPNVPATKQRTDQILADYLSPNALPPETPAVSDETIAVFGDVSGETPVQALDRFLGEAGVGAYVNLQAWLPRTGEVEVVLQTLRTTIRDTYRLATTVDYGPDYLHGTGQLHKGDAGDGLFVQFTADSSVDAPIPDEAGKKASSLTFGVFSAAQALADRQVLLGNGRRVLRFHLGANPVQALAELSGRASSQ